MGQELPCVPSFAGEEDGKEGGGGKVAVRSKMDMALPHSAGTVSTMVLPCHGNWATVTVWHLCLSFPPPSCPSQWPQLAGSGAEAGGGRDRACGGGEKGCGLLLFP